MGGKVPQIRSRECCWKSALLATSCLILGTRITPQRQLSLRNETCQLVRGSHELGQAQGIVSEARELVLRSKCPHLAAEQPCASHATLLSLSFFSCKLGVQTVKSASPCTVQSKGRDVCEAALQTVKPHADGIRLTLDK